MIMGPTQVGWQDSIACSSEVPDETPFLSCFHLIDESDVDDYVEEEEDDDDDEEDDDDDDEEDDDDDDDEEYG